MKKILLILSALTVSVFTANAAVVGLFNTGVNLNGVGLLTYPNTDSHYGLTIPSTCCAPDGTPTSPVVVNSGVGIYPANNGTWVSDASSLASQWVGPVPNFNSNGSAPSNLNGLFTYSLAVTAGGGETVTGRWTSDNNSCIALNSVVSSINCIGLADFNKWTPFSIGGFTGGANTIQFQVNNISGPTGLRVEFDNIPEPNSLLLLLSGLTGFGFLLRRART